MVNLQAFKTALARRLREARGETGMSQARLAQLVGVHPSAICQYELGKRVPYLSILVAIARELDVSLDDLVPDREEYGTHANVLESQTSIYDVLDEKGE